VPDSGKGGGNEGAGGRRDAGAAPKLGLQTGCGVQLFRVSGFQGFKLLDLGGRWKLSNLLTLGRHHGANARLVRDFQGIDILYLFLPSCQTVCFLLRCVLRAWPRSEARVAVRMLADVEMATPAVPKHGFDREYRADGS
jgi:hypothetical protein